MTDPVVQAPQLDMCEQVEARIYPAVLPEVPGRARARVRRVLASVDLEATRVKAAKARSDRFVQWNPGVTAGMTVRPIRAAGPRRQT